jgi:hypothetical protein
MKYYLLEKMTIFGSNTESNYGEIVKEVVKYDVLPRLLREKPFDEGEFYVYGYDDEPVKLKDMEEKDEYFFTGEDGYLVERESFRAIEITKEQYNEYKSIISSYTNLSCIH